VSVLPKIQAFVCLVLDERFTNTFLPSSGHRNNMEEKMYPAMDLPVYGEADGASFIFVEN